MSKRKEIKMNPLRAKLLEKMRSISILRVKTTDVSLSFDLLQQMHSLNQEFMDRSRGKGKSKSFIKSVALQRIRSTLFPHSERFGSNERARGSSMSRLSYITS